MRRKTPNNPSGKAKLRKAGKSLSNVDPDE
jgi:hypothetical protein